ncbi:MAG: hypothetical protein HC935_01400 [Pseudanabaena sp. SU_2_4]|nr:hypothetical protein [Pseudanabaena sp. SU_2_4]
MGGKSETRLLGMTFRLSMLKRTINPQNTGTDFCAQNTQVFINLVHQVPGHC